MRVLEVERGRMMYVRNDWKIRGAFVMVRSGKGTIVINQPIQKLYSL